MLGNDYDISVSVHLPRANIHFFGANGERLPLRSAPPVQKLQRVVAGRRRHLLGLELNGKNSYSHRAAKLEPSPLLWRGAKTYL